MLPWMKFYTRDWLDNKELRRCSPACRSVLVDLMCLAQEGIPYGHLSDKIGPLTTGYMASRCVMTPGAFVKATAELLDHGRIAITKSGVTYIPRMVEDEDIRARRSQDGGKGGNPKLVKGEVNHKVAVEVKPEDKVAPARADSDSDSLGVTPSLKEETPERARPKQALVPAKAPEPAISGRFREFATEWQRGTGSTLGLVAAENSWCAYITAEMEAGVFDCLASYLDSRQVSEGAVHNASNWIAEQHREKWRNRWTSVQRKPTRHEETHMQTVDAMRAMNQARKS